MQWTEHIGEGASLFQSGWGNLRADIRSRYSSNKQKNLLYHSMERRHPLLTWPPHQGLCGFRPPIIPHILLGSVAICFTWGLARSAGSPWLMGKGCSWGWAGGEGLRTTCSSSTWLSTLALCALSGNKLDCPQGKSWGDQVKGHEAWQYYCSNGKSGIHC